VIAQAGRLVALPSSRRNGRKLLFDATWGSLRRRGHSPAYVARRMGWHGPEWAVSALAYAACLERLAELQADARAPSLTGHRRKTAIKYARRILAELADHRIAMRARGWRLP
jgi:hypothetical protein